MPLQYVLKCGHLSQALALLPETEHAGLSVSDREVLALLSTTSPLQPGPPTTKRLKNNLLFLMKAAKGFLTFLTKSTSPGWLLGVGHKTNRPTPK